MWEQVMEVTGAKSTKAARYRWAALGFVKTCSRCGGGGKFSYNQIDGDKCYGCSGSGKQLVTPTEKRIEEARRLVEAGSLAPYLEKVAAQRAYERQVRELLAEIDAQLDCIGKAYDAAYKTQYWTKWNGPAVTVTCAELRPLMERVHAVRDAARGARPDVEALREQTKQIRAEWDAR